VAVGVIIGMDCRRIHFELLKKVRGISKFAIDRSYLPSYFPTALAQEIYETKILCEKLLGELKEMDCYSQEIKELLAILESEQNDPKTMAQ
jgi:hypothetical protein